MNRDIIDTILNRMDKYNYKLEESELCKLLDLDDKVSKYIYSENEKEYFIKAIKIGMYCNELLNNSDSNTKNSLPLSMIFNRKYYDEKIKILDSSKLNVQDKISAITTINRVKSSEVANLISNVISDENLIDNGTNFECVKSIYRVSGIKRKSIIYELYKNEDFMNSKDREEGLKLIKGKCYDLNLDYIKKILCNKKAIDNNISLVGATILSYTKNINDLEYVYNTIINDKLIELDISLRSAATMNRVKNDNGVRYMYNYIENLRSNNKDRIISDLNIIKDCKSIDSCRKFTKILTTSNDMLEINGAREIANSKLKHQEDYILKLVDNKTVKMYGNSLLYSRVINDSKNKFNAQYAYKILTNKELIEKNMEVACACLINLSENWYNAYYLSKFIVSNYMIDLHYIYKSADILNTNASEYNIKYAYDILNKLKENNNKSEIFNEAYSVVKKNAANKSLEELQKEKLSVKNLKELIKYIDSSEIDSKKIKQIIKQR